MKGLGWKIAGWLLRLLPFLVIGGFLHFYLPSKDVVRIVDTDVKRMDVASGDPVIEGDGAPQAAVSRDVRFINAAWPNGEPRVYRNEETGWGFPWYFKFDSSNVQTAAQDLRSTKENPQWVVITHYGWRIEIFSMFPNAVDLDPVDSPDYFPVPWFSIGFLTLLAIALVAAWIAWRNFVVNRWRPFMAELALDDRFENATSGVAQVWRWMKVNIRDRFGGRRD